MNAYILQLTLLQSYLQHSKGRHWKSYISSFHKINVQLCVETNMKKKISIATLKSSPDLSIYKTKFLNSI